MKISTETVKLLQNFAGVNNNIRIYPGNVVSTISPSKQVFARATVTEDFPQDFCVYDLNSLLSLITLSDDPDLEFGESNLKIRKGNSEIEYFYAAPDVIIAPEAGKNIPVDVHYQFNITAADLLMLTKAAGALAAKYVSIVSKKGTTTISVGDPKTAGSNSYRRTLDACEHDFNCQIAIENLKVVPEDYIVTLSKKKFVHFKHSTRELEYWLAMELTSTI